MVVAFISHVAILLTSPLVLSLRLNRDCAATVPMTERHCDERRTKKAAARKEQRPVSRSTAES
jgi:hypothetical protein